MTILPLPGFSNFEQQLHSFHALLLLTAEYMSATRRYHRELPNIFLNNGGTGEREAIVYSRPKCTMLVPSETGGCNDIRATAPE